MPCTNQLGQPVGDDLPNEWQPPQDVAPVILEGPHVRLEPLRFDHHGDGLWAAMQHDQIGEGWTYMTYGPFANKEAMRSWVETNSAGSDPLYFALVDLRSEQAVGWASYLRINLRDASVEVGSIRMSPLAQRTTLATEAMHLMMKHAFELGFRRYEWKCDSLNAPSRRAAERLGFQFEGIFRNATHYKGRSRDTAWYSVTAEEWNELSQTHESWLAPENFDADGKQRSELSVLTSRSTSRNKGL